MDVRAQSTVDRLRAIFFGAVMTCDRDPATSGSMNQIVPTCNDVLHFGAKD
jgi:hypothetical protein